MAKKTSWVDFSKRAMVLLALGLLAGCGVTSRMEVPKAQSSDAASTKAAAVSMPLDEQATFALTKVVANIRRGTTIAHFPSMGAGLGGGLCNVKHIGKSTLEWGSGSAYLGGWRDEFGEIFFEVLSGRGLKIAGDPSQLFESEKEVQAAEYSIGARIKDIKGNFCEVYDFWSGLSLNSFKGEMFVDVEWTVYSNLQKRRILKLQTQGYYKLTQPKKNGIFVVFQEAFAQATEKLALSSKFTDLALRRLKEDELKPNTSPTIFITETKLRRKQVDKKLNNVLPAVVTVRVGRGHGSGFLISTDGLILTNQHVVVGAKTVAIILNNGLEVVGEVLRTDKVRDVALVKAPVRIPNALPIRKKLAERLEKVYVIGTPLKEALGSTITAGIVSALRTRLKTGQVLIQSDAAITGGNSGGPLVDEYGNVIGISVLSYIHGQNLNLFIPIGEALEQLNIEIRPKDKVS